MASCHRCKKPISSIDAKKAITTRDENGKLKGMEHYKCFMQGKAKERHTNVQLRTKGGPSAYEAAAAYANKDDETPEAIAKRERLEAEMLALHQRQEEINQQRQEESATRGFSDWREPLEADLDDMLATNSLPAPPE